jgi:hypothetical protein
MLSKNYKHGIADSDHHEGGRKLKMPYGRRV